MIGYYLAEDAASGRILEDSFTINGPSAPSVFEGKDRWASFIESRARDWCQAYNLRYIVSDGPFTLFMCRYGGKQPKWTKAPPAEISAEKWRKRFTSLDQLFAFREGADSRQ